MHTIRLTPTNVNTGFARKRQYNTKAQSIYHRPAVKKNPPSGPVDPVTGVSTAKPIVFVHGIGKYSLLFSKVVTSRPFVIRHACLSSLLFMSPFFCISFFSFFFLQLFLLYFLFFLLPFPLPISFPLLFFLSPSVTFSYPQESISLLLVSYLFHLNLFTFLI